MLVVPILKNYF